MSAVIHSDLIILGSGPAACTAAIYAARANLHPLIITGMELGGQLTKTTMVDNWPGAVNGIDGSQLTSQMLEHAQRFATQVISDHITAVNLKTSPFQLTGESNYTCRALIIATGASAKYLGLPAENTYMGRGVSACAVCDGFFYKGKNVAIVGGGNTAAEDALYLAKLAKEVTLIHRRDTLRAEPILIEQLIATPNIRIQLESEILDIEGDDSGVNAVVIQQINTKTRTILPISGIFIAIGHTPNTEIFIDQLSMDHGYITVTGGNDGNSTATSIPGVFAAGDVTDKVYRQAIIAAGSGCMAALDAKRYLG